jgi:hypothetical protein
MNQAIYNAPDAERYSHKMKLRRSSVTDARLFTLVVRRLSKKKEVLIQTINVLKILNQDTKLGTLPIRESERPFDLLGV